jgi:AraC-like DNA-binding protein
MTASEARARLEAAGLTRAEYVRINALVSSLAGQLVDCLDSDGPERDRVGGAVLDLVTVALAERLNRAEAAVPAGTRQRMLLMRIRTFIDQHLDDVDLSPPTIAAAHHISLRHLHKLFEGEEVTVAGWIRRRRLERCRQDLQDPALWDRPVSAIGARWGFANPVYFSRLFRRTYGIPPARYRQERLVVLTQGSLR